MPFTCNHPWGWAQRAWRVAAWLRDGGPGHRCVRGDPAVGPERPEAVVVGEAPRRMADRLVATPQTPDRPSRSVVGDQAQLGVELVHLSDVDLDDGSRAHCRLPARCRPQLPRGAPGQTVDG